jgi:hypothetical protein
VARRAKVAQWRVEPSQLKKLWFAGFTAANYKLTFDVADKISELESVSGGLTVKVTFTDYLTGKVLNEEKLIRIIEDPPLTEPNKKGVHK